MAEAPVVTEQPRTTAVPLRGSSILAVPVDSSHILQQVIIRLRETIIKETDVLRKFSENFIGMLYDENIRSITYLTDVISNDIFMIHTEIPSLIVPPRLVEYSYKTRMLTILSTASMSLRDIIRTITQQMESIVSLQTLDTSKLEQLNIMLDHYITLLLAIHESIIINGERILGILSINLDPLNRPAVANMLFTERDIFTIKR